MTDTDMELGELYGEGARALQQAFDSERLAGALQAFTVHDALTDDDVALVRAHVRNTGA
jgi:hypothetical protein